MDTLLLCIIIYLFISFIGLIIILYYMKNAPLGYEDEAGFHELKDEGSEERDIVVIADEDSIEFIRERIMHEQLFFDQHK